MKTIHKLGSLLIANLLVGTAAYAKSYTCVSDKFPANYGSTFVISDKDFQGKPTHHLQFTLGKTVVGNDVFKAEGEYDGFKSYNEDHTEMLYFNWYAGSYSNEAEGALVPSKIFLYDFAGNMSNSHTAFVGVSTYQKLDGDYVKIEHQYVYKCQ